jgi:fatty acid desaturase
MDDWIARGGLKAVSRDRLRALSVKSDARGWLQTGGFVAALAVTTTGLAGPFGFPPIVLVVLFLAQGALLNCLYAGQHELSHWTVFRVKWLNDRVGELFGFLTLNPFHTDRWAHFAHHRETQNPLRDSELIGMKPLTTWGHVLNLIGLDFWRRRIASILRAAAGRGLEADYWLTPDEARFVVAEARVTVALWGLIAALSIAAGSWAAVYLWIGPLLLTKGVHQLQNTGEHVGMPHDPDIFTNTRTLRGPAWMRWLMWNMSFHTAHHAFPGVPFHALPALHREIVAGLDRPIIERGYIEAQREIFAWLANQEERRRPAT